jgi:hypothetical protein
LVCISNPYSAPMVPPKGNVLTVVVHFSLLPRRRSHRRAFDWHGGSREYGARSSSSRNVAKDGRRFPGGIGMDVGKPTVLVHIRVRSQVCLWHGFALRHSRFRH